MIILIVPTIDLDILNFRCQSSLDMSEFDKSKVRSRAKANEEIFVQLQQKKMSEEKKSKEESDEKKEKYRRSSSLRSGKTPPGTPARRKIVRFGLYFENKEKI